MKRYASSLLLGISAALLAGPVQAQVLIDFNDQFDGPVNPEENPPLLYQFHGPTGNIGTPEYNLDFSHAIVDNGGGDLAYQQSFDGTGLDVMTGLFDPPYFFYVGGGGGFFTPADSGMTGLGEDDPSNYTFSWDIKVSGEVVDVPLYVGFGQHDADYEATYGVDITGDENNNNGPDGDMLDGADPWIVENVPVQIDMSNEGYQTWSINLADAIAAGDGPSATAGVAPENVLFDNENLFYFNWFFGHTEFGFDGENSITFDNIAIDFTPVVVGAGDYNGDNLVNLADYTIWRNNLGGDNAALMGNGDESGGSMGVVDMADYDYWKANFGRDYSEFLGGAVAVAIPEPATAALALCAVVAIGVARRTREKA
ncbi:hypothetical protein [Aeoliella sp.]|uniref:hypothetical protein n=1 Tax=Aeoliella sp. TaxID=2795800 RepID=UPI003CCC0040